MVLCMKERSINVAGVKMIKIVLLFLYRLMFGQLVLFCDDERIMQFPIMPTL